MDWQIRLLWLDELLVVLTDSGRTDCDRELLNLRDVKNTREVLPRVYVSVLPWDQLQL